MKNDYEKLKICFIEFSGEDILTISPGNDNDNDATDVPDWGFADDWGNNI